MITIANDNTPKTVIIDRTPEFDEVLPETFRVDVIQGVPVVTDHLGQTSFHVKMLEWSNNLLATLDAGAFERDFMVNHEIHRPTGKVWFGAFIGFNADLKRMHIFPYAEKSPAWQRIKYKSSNDAGWDMLQFLKTGVIAA